MDIIATVKDTIYISETPDSPPVATIYFEEDKLIIENVGGVEVEERLPML